MISDLLGRLHPALVHLPIGILLLGLLFELLSGEKRFRSIAPAIPVIIFWGMISAVISCVTGLFLNSGGDYEEELVQPHQWAGIALAVLSILLFILYKRKVRNGIIKLFSILTLALVFLTGHLGGTITHGEGFLSIQGEDASTTVEMKPIPDIQQAMIYTDIVQPLFKSRCYSCHGTRKQKGKLRLDEQEYILKGGESGETILPGKAEESEMIERLMLPMDDDDHMPPKGKPQLTKEQVEMLRWWVNTGADFHKKVSDLQQPEHIKPVLLALQSGKPIEKEEIEMVPEKQVEAADSKVISKLNDAGVSLVPVARGSNYLAASFFNSLVPADSLLSQLSALNNQLISLKLDGIPVGENGMKSIAKLSALRKLQLSNTTVTDQQVLQLQNLKNLRSLNLVGTSVTSNGILQLKNLKELKYVYIYKTRITPAEGEALKSQFAHTDFDFGNYSLPMLEGDTTEIKF